MGYQARVGCPLFYRSLDEGIDSFMSTGPAAAAGKHHAEAKVKETIAHALQSFRLTEDTYHLQNQFLIFIAEK